MSAPVAVFGSRLGWAVAAALGLGSVLAAGCGRVAADSGAAFRGVTELVPADSRGGLWFGFSLAASGSWLGVGAPNHGADSTGAVYLFETRGADATPRGLLRPPAPTGDDEFGYSVAIDGDLALVGAPRHDARGSDSGAAYVFRRSSRGWDLEAKLVPGDAAPDEGFGWSVALGGGLAVVGLHRDPDNIVVPAGGSGVARKRGQGAVYVFAARGADWAPIARLVPDDWKTADDGFGQWVATDGETIAVGARADDGAADDDGAVYLFSRAGGEWSQSAKLSAADAATKARFGHRVSIDGDTLLVGAPGGYNHFLSSIGRGDERVEVGAAYVFTRDSGGWRQTAKLEPPDGQKGDRFGSSVDLRGDRLIVGATAGERRSYAIVYRRNGDDWEGIARFLQADASAGNYGSSTALGATHAFIGAFNKATADGSGAGIVYVAY